MAVQTADGWYASSIVRAPGADRGVPAKEVVPPVTAATQQDALEDIVRRDARVDRSRGRPVAPSAPCDQPSPRFSCRRATRMQTAQP
jgi:hypothetical protein